MSSSFSLSGTWAVTSGLVRMKRKRELLKPQTHRVPEAPRVGFVLKAHNDIIRETQDNDVACCFPPSPPIGPEIKDIV